jgi:hypothetical protein
VNVTVTAVNDPPTATNDSASTSEEAPVEVSVLVNDSDIDSTGLSVSGVTNGAHGTVTTNGTTVRYVPALNYFGSDSFTYMVSDGDGGTAAATVNVSISPVNDVPVFTAVTPATQNVDYSDPITTVNVAAFDVDDAASNLTLEVVGSVPAGLTAEPGATPGTLTISGSPTVAAGSYPIEVKVTDAAGASQTTSVTINVGKEKLEPTYTGDTAVITAGPSVTTATFRLAAHLTQDADGSSGDISLATVTFELYKTSNLSNVPDRVVSGVAVDSAGDTLPVTISNVGEDTYTVKVTVDGANGYWTADPIGISTVNVTVGTNDQRANGGGWVPDSESANGKGNFGYTVRNEKGSPKGTFSYVFKGTDGFTYVVKSNAWQGGFLNFATDVNSTIVSRASFKAKANVMKIDPETGLVVQSWGNYAVTVDTRDGDLFDPKQADRIAITVNENSGRVWHRIGAPASLVEIGGGNVQVKGK